MISTLCSPPILWLKRHPDVLGAVLVGVVAATLRAAFLLRAPIFVTGDSESYLGPAVDLARGLGLDLSLKRTPGYPGFVALVMSVLGQDLRSLLFAQHGLGVLTAILTFGLGRWTFGWPVGLTAGLLTGINGALVLSEHTILTEALFVPLVVAALTALVSALRTGSFPLYALAGLLLGAAALTRPVAQALVPLVPLAVVLVERRLRPSLGYSAVAIGAFGLSVLPWVLWSVSEHDSATVGSLGQTLVGRTARHDRGAFSYYVPALDDGDPDVRRLYARQVLQEAADRGSSGKAIHTRLRRELGLSAAETDHLMRDLAIEAILRRPGYYVQGTLQRFVRLSLGSVERFGAYRNAADVARQRWEDDESRDLLVPASCRRARGADVSGAREPLPAQLPGCGASPPLSGGPRTLAGASSLATSRPRRPGRVHALVHQRRARRQRLALPLPGRPALRGARAGRGHDDHSRFRIQRSPFASRSSRDARRPRTTSDRSVER